MLLKEGWLFVRVTTDEGLVGLGEASQGGNAATISHIDQIIRPWLIGRDPTYLEPLSTAMLARAEGRGSATAVSAVEQALFDIWGQSLGVPIWRLLGGKYRDRVPLYANINRAIFDRSPDSFADHASRAVADGFRAVKCAPFDGVDLRQPDRAANRQGIALGIERIFSIREAVGKEIGVMVDCHSRFDVPTAIQVGRALESANLGWLEEPVPSVDLTGIERVRDNIPMPIAGAEAFIGRAGFFEAIARRSFDLIMPDVKHTGGILELRKIAALAEVHRLGVSPHNPSGPISTLASLHLCAAIPNCPMLEYPWGETSWRPSLTIPAEPIEDGALVVPDRPGLGFTLDEDTVLAHAPR